MPTNNLRRALNYGPTTAVRFFVAFAALLQSARFLLGSPDWLATQEELHSVFPVPFWGFAFFIVGALAIWRTTTHRPSPNWGWSVNVLMCLVWMAGMIVRTKIDVTTLLSAYTVITLMAAWCLLRTEATPNDTRTT